MEMTEFCGKPSSLCQELIRYSDCALGNTAAPETAGCGPNKSLAANAIRVIWRIHRRMAEWCKNYRFASSIEPAKICDSNSHNEVCLINWSRW